MRRNLTRNQSILHVLFPGNVLLMINIFSFEYHDVNDNTATVYKH